MAAKKKSITKKKEIKPESIYEMARHLGYYQQVDTSFRNVFIFAQLAQIMLFVANLFNGNTFGTIAIIASVFLSYISQKHFHDQSQKSGSLFQKIGICLALLSALALCCPHFYQL